jgi:hypothetical protein
MQKRNSVLAAVGLVLAAGCTGKTDFDITKTFDPVDSAGSPATYTLTQHVDMAAEAGSAWKHRSKVKSLDLVGLTGTMTQNHSGPATTGSGSIVLTRNGSSVTVGTWRDEPMPASGSLPHSIGTTLEPAGAALVMDALKNDGLFDVTLAGSTAAAVNFGADVTLHLKMRFKVP